MDVDGIVIALPGRTTNVVATIKARTGDRGENVSAPDVNTPGSGVNVAGVPLYGRRGTLQPYGALPEIARRYRYRHGTGENVLGKRTDKWDDATLPPVFLMRA